jgi:hypothetical protein
MLTQQNASLIARPIQVTATSSSARLRKHGHAPYGRKSRTYVSWARMLQRCTNPANTKFNRYGGANPPVRVCERWLSFENFLADMGVRPESTSLGRYLDLGGYRPDNCAWMTRAEQGAERKGNSAVKQFRKTKTLLAALGISVERAS